MRIFLLAFFFQLIQLHGRSAFVYAGWKPFPPLSSLPEYDELSSEARYCVDIVRLLNLTSCKPSKDPEIVCLCSAANFGDHNAPLYPEGGDLGVFWYCCPTYECSTDAKDYLNLWCNSVDVNSYRTDTTPSGESDDRTTTPAATSNTQQSSSPPTLLPRTTGHAGTVSSGTQCPTFAGKLEDDFQLELEIVEPPNSTSTTIPIPSTDLADAFTYIIIAFYVLFVLASLVLLLLAAQALLVLVTLAVSVAVMAVVYCIYRYTRGANGSPSQNPSSGPAPTDMTGVPARGPNMGLEEGERNIVGRLRGPIQRPTPNLTLNPTRVDGVRDAHVRPEIVQRDHGESVGLGATSPRSLRYEAALGLYNIQPSSDS